MSIALRVLPPRLELKRRDGSGILAPRANVSFTTFVYASPVQTIPWCDQTGVPIHFHSSVISGSASRINARMRARVSPRHPPRSRIRWSMSREAVFPVARSRLLIPARTGASPSAFVICGLPPARSFTGLASLAPSLALVPAFGGDLDLVADLRGLLARDVPLAFGLALLSVIIRPLLLDVCQVALGFIPKPLIVRHPVPYGPELCRDEAIAAFSTMPLLG